MNLIHNGADQGSGLLGYVNGFTVDVNSDEGMFMTDADALSKPAVYPKIVKLNFELNVLHEHPMGWENTSGVGQLRGVKSLGFLIELIVRCHLRGNLMESQCSKMVVLMDLLAEADPAEFCMATQVKGTEICQ